MSTQGSDTGKCPVGRALGIAALGAVGVAAYGALVGARRIEVSEHEVPLPGLPPELDGLRVVQVSDFHFSPFFRAGSTRRVVALANACRPDLVTLTGDFVSLRSLGYVAPAASELGGLRARLGVFACLGNHDHWEGAGEVRGALEAAGARVLLNESLPLEGGLRLAAVDDLMAGQPDLGLALRDVPPAAPLLLLSHNPTILPQLGGRPCLVLSGHTHGGQIALPFLGPRHTPKLPGMGPFIRWYEGQACSFFFCRREAIATHRYPAGWYADGGTRMYVNRGIGVGHAVPIRLNCRPEIVCFVLRSPDA